MVNEESLREAIRACSEGVGSPLSDEVSNEVRFGSENHPENTAPYDDKKLAEGMSSFFENHPFIMELR